MKFVGRRFAWLLPLLLSACAHHNNQAQVQALAPPIEDTPPPPPDSAPANLPPPVITIPKTPEPVIVPPAPPKPAPKRHKSKSSNSTQGGTSAGQVASESAPPEVSAIGKFETPEGPNTKKQAENSIAEIERGLNGIGRKLNDQEEKTSVQIREFLKQARAALSSGDVDGAKTLTAKAKALLGELTQ